MEESRETTDRPLGYIDRIEGSMAVIVFDDGTSIDLPLKLLPGGARPGDHVRIAVEIDAEATGETLNRIAELRRRLGGRVDPQETNYKL